ncbi:MAG: hypothetical protein ACR2K3_00680, partial [Nocardioides sp.]
AIFLTTVAGLIGAGALADVAAISPTRPGGDLYAIQGNSGTELRAALQVPGALRILQISSGGHQEGVADCPTLSGIIAFESVAAARDFDGQCVAGHQFVISGSGTRGPHRVILPEAQVPTVVRGPLVALDPASYDGPPGQRAILAYPGPTSAEVDNYLNDVLGAAPTSQVTDLSADSFKPMVAPTRRLLVICSGFGLLVGATLLLVAGLQMFQRSRPHLARLVVLGAPQSLGARVHLISLAIAATVALSMGTVIGTLAAMTYDLAGGFVSGPGALGVKVILISMAATAASVVVSWAFARIGSRQSMIEVIHRE